MKNIWDERKTGLEEEYFHRKEQDALEKTRQRLAAESQERGTEVSVLHCPQCGEKLEVVSFHKIMIDRCASCQGVWLDPGELECLTAQESQSWQTHFQRSAEHWTKRLQQKKRYRED
jgi:uncharacterized protein